MNSRPKHWKKMTILQVEDDPALAQLVRLAFESFGFRGEILRAGMVAEAIAILTERERERAPLDLVLVDMQLPDGNGLDVLRQVKESPVWHRTPVIVLSGETAPGLINEAYALGANCYLPKLPRTDGVFGGIRSLYQCWIEGALLPQPSFTDQAGEALARGVNLRARTARFYLGLAKVCNADPEQEGFWLERALTEGNLSNLLAFFQGQISNGDVPAGMGERAAAMQVKVEKVLNQAEAFLTMRPSPAPEEICRWVLVLAEAWDEEVFAETIGALFLKNPAVTMALQARAACQLRELAGHLLERSGEPELCRRADALLAFASRLAVLGQPQRSRGSG